MQRTRFGDMVYSITRTREIAGEPWSPLIIRDVWVGVTRFDELQRDLGMSTQGATERLKWLVAQGVLEQRVYSERPCATSTCSRRRAGSSPTSCSQSAPEATAGRQVKPARHSPPPPHLRAPDPGRAPLRNCGKLIHASEVDVEPGPGAKRAAQSATDVRIAPTSG